MSATWGICNKNSNNNVWSERKLTKSKHNLKPWTSLCPGGGWLEIVGRVALRLCAISGQGNNLIENFLHFSLVQLGLYCVQVVHFFVYVFV